MKAWLYTLSITILTFLPVLGKAQQANCKLFHTGKFKIIDTANKCDILVDRNDTVERRMMYRQKPGSNKKTYDMQVVFKIKWTDVCTYTAKVWKTIIETSKGERLLPTPRKAITVRILKSSNDAYLEQGTFNEKPYTSYRYVVYKL